MTGYNVEPVVASEIAIREAIDASYGSTHALELKKVMDEMAATTEAARRQLEEGPGGGGKTSSAQKLEAASEDAPVIKLVNDILVEAIKERGVGHPHRALREGPPRPLPHRRRALRNGPPAAAPGLCHHHAHQGHGQSRHRRTRLPQDGRIELTVGGHPVDLRVAVLPTMFGESVVMRVLDRSIVKLDLNAVGMNADLLRQFRVVIEKPNGIVLVTGPTGSGKTTTLYSALSELNKIEDKLITTEDPIEYDIDGIVQVPIDAAIGNTFAFCLRSILRQDPDKILVGEIRDVETAEIAVQASLTGHMVFSTLHTNDAPSTVTRLRDMGVAPFLISATVEPILAQRLVRRVCSHCRDEVRPSTEMLAELGLTPDDVRDKQFYRGRGCDICNNTGYKGRVGLFELMIINDDLREMILKNSSTDELRDKACSYGMISLRDAGLEAVYAGTTTVEEVVRETVLRRPEGSAMSVTLHQLSEDRGRTGRHGPARLRTNTPPQIRIDGELVPLQMPALSAPETKTARLLRADRARRSTGSRRNLEIDFSFGVKGLARFRANVYNQRGARRGGLPAHPVGDQGVPGSGAARDRGQDSARPPARPGPRHRPDRVGEIDDAGGHDRQDQQRAVGAHRDDRGSDRVPPPPQAVHRQPARARRRHALLRNALQSVLRQDPDVVLIGEMRDLETIESALRDRRDGPPDLRHPAHQLGRADDQPHHRRLPGPPAVPDPRAALLRAGGNPLPDPAAARERRRPALAMEVMIPNSAIRNLIREDKVHQIYSVMQTGQARNGMQTFNQSLATLYFKKQITLQTALSVSTIRTNCRK